MVTGGQFSKGNVVRYNEDGFVEDLPQLISGRWSHACSLFTNSRGEKVKNMIRIKMQYLSNCIMLCYVILM